MHHVKLTYLSHAVGFTKALSLPFILPGLEQVLEHRRFSALGHHLHSGAGWVALGFDEALMQKNQTRNNLKDPYLIYLQIFHCIFSIVFPAKTHIFSFLLKLMLYWTFN